MFDNREVMRNKEVGETELFLEVLEEVDDFCLDGDIQGRNGFVADNKFWLHGEGAGDTNPLTLAAGEFMRMSG